MVIFCFEKISSPNFCKLKRGIIMRYTPPQKIALSKQIKKSLIASAVLIALGSETLLAAPDKVIDKNYLANDGFGDEYKTAFTTNETFDEINLPDFTPPSRQSQFAVYVDHGGNLTITGNTYINSFTSGPSGSDGTYAITAGSFHNKTTGTINLEGNIEIYVKHDPEMTSSYGANAIYSSYEGSIINLGSKGTTTTIWAFDHKPDAISTKNGGSVHFLSTNNKLVGSIDMIGNMDALSLDASEVTGTFSGKNSYWYGDDQSFGNTDVGTIPFFGLILANKSKLYLTFSNGAQWSYFGLVDKVSNGSLTLNFIPKRISEIRLLDGGIINLHDEILEHQWKEIGIWDILDDSAKGKHDYVRIGNLKGNGGVFYLDLDASHKSQSDMIFIEDSSEAGTHFIEPYNLEKLEGVHYGNTLTFALTTRSANGVSFADKQNIYGDSLFDYELIIDHETIDKNNQELIDKIEGQVDNYETFDDFDIEDYYNGTHWFIKRLLTKESAASIGMRSAGYASYDLAVNMDRRDRRLQNAIFQNEEKDGLWARVQYGEAGAEHLYNADLTTVYVGYEKATSADNRLGFSFAYTDGDSDFNDLKGTGELKRYEASVYDTLTFGSHYLDFVARFGQVDNEFDVTNQSRALTTTGSFDQKYAALSAEYGYNFKDEHNVFIEPQVQLQVAYLGDYNYRTERNMKVDADSDISVIGRVGLRAGKAFESSDYVGELYARADVLHQFTDGQDAQFSDLSNKVGVTWGDKDTWSTFGVGGYLNCKDNMSFQVDVERTAGGETIDTWLVSGRVNYLF